MSHTRPVLRCALIALSALAFAPAAAPAKAYTSSSKASPAYPESTIAMKVKGKPRAKGIATLVVSGANASRDDGDGLAFDYTLDVYVQDRSVFKGCAATQTEQNRRLATLPGKVEHIGLGESVPASGPFKTTIKYRTEGFRKLVFCAYTTYVVDTAAVGTLKHDLLKRKKKKRKK
jgi:hypothetical protein